MFAHFFCLLVRMLGPQKDGGTTQRARTNRRADGTDRQADSLSPGNVLQHHFHAHTIKVSI